MSETRWMTEIKFAFLDLQKYPPREKNLGSVEIPMTKVERKSTLFLFKLGCIFISSMVSHKQAPIQNFYFQFYTGNNIVLSV